MAENAGNKGSAPDGEDDAEEDVYRVETVPPPESGDAYSAPTVVKEAPEAVLNAIRRAKVKRAAGARDVTSAQDAAPIVPRPPRVPQIDTSAPPAKSTTSASPSASPRATSELPSGAPNDSAATHANSPPGESLAALTQPVIPPVPPAPPASAPSGARDDASDDPVLEIVLQPPEVAEMFSRERLIVLVVSLAVVAFLMSVFLLARC